MNLWKGTLLATIFLCSVQLVNGQEETEKVAKGFNDKVSSVNEIGINSTFFINTFMSFNTINPTVVSPYALTYKFRKGQGGFRFGIGGMYREEKDDDSSNSFKTTNGNVDVRVGGEFNMPVGRKWRAFFGADLIVGYDVSKSINEQSNTTVTTSLETTEFGGGPVIGIDVMLAKRVKLGTETSVAFKRTLDVEKVDFSNPLFEDDIDRTTGFNFTFDLPTSLYLIIMF